MRDFGKDVKFWAGGLVFNTVPDILADVSPGNVIAM